ncbi:MAG: tRNA (adenosine(37)-N6)-threonylcarbamoyltransferase complex dimerization subunit type 1 TsaB [Tissierellia bacterium]|nr:tRNA (adenosine(37)-N6)-threonylcarbamoyltransferase complex dimerization subunit type 1 TsaB [Tissierellia bacterium]
MKVLAIDTSTMISSVGILDGEYTLGEYSLNQVKTHSELLLPMTDDLLKKLNLTFDDIDLFAVAKGPGSFTGLRIGMSAVKSMAQVLDKKIVGVSTLEALAYGIVSDRLIMPLIDARGKRYFSAVYKWKDGQLHREVEEGLFKEKDIVEFLKNTDKDFVLVGDAIHLIKDKLSDLNNIQYANARQNNCLAISIGQLAAVKAQEGKFDSYYDLAPNYIRKSQAELDYDKRNN